MIGVLYFSQWRSRAHIWLVFWGFGGIGYEACPCIWSSWLVFAIRVCCIYYMTVKSSHLTSQSWKSWAAFSLFAVYSRWASCCCSSSLLYFVSASRCSRSSSMSSASSSFLANWFDNLKFNSRFYWSTVEFWNCSRCVSSVFCLLQSWRKSSLFSTSSWSRSGRRISQL